MADRLGVHDPANAAKVAAGRRKAGRKAVADGLGVHDPANTGAWRGAWHPSRGASGAREGGEGGIAPGRPSWPPGTELLQCPTCKAWGAYGKVHSLIMGPGGLRRGGPYKRCGRFTVPAA